MQPGRTTNWLGCFLHRPCSVLGTKVCFLHCPCLVPATKVCFLHHPCLVPGTKVCFLHRPCLVPGTKLPSTVPANSLWCSLSFPAWIRYQEQLFGRLLI